MKIGDWIDGQYELTSALDAFDGDERFVAIDHKTGSTFGLYLPDNSNPDWARHVADCDLEFHNLLSSYPFDANVIAILKRSYVKRVSQTQNGPPINTDDIGRPFLLCQPHKGRSLWSLCQGPQGWRPGPKDFYKLAADVISTLLAAIEVREADNAFRTILLSVSPDNIIWEQGAASFVYFNHDSRCGKPDSALRRWFQSPERRWDKLRHNHSDSFEINRAMVYCVSLLLYFVRTGDLPPWTADGLKDLDEARQLFQQFELNEGIEPALSEVLERGWNLDPARRYQNLQELDEELQACRGEPPIEVPSHVRRVTVRLARIRDGSVVISECCPLLPNQRLVRLSEKGVLVDEGPLASRTQGELKREIKGAASSESARSLVPRKRMGRTGVTYVHVVRAGSHFNWYGWYLRRRWGKDLVLDWKLRGDDRRPLPELVAALCRTSPLLYDYHVLLYNPGSKSAELSLKFSRDTTTARPQLAKVTVNAAADGELRELHVVVSRGGTLESAVAIKSWQVRLKAGINRIFLRLVGPADILCEDGFEARPIAFNRDYLLRRLERQSTGVNRYRLALMIETTDDHLFSARKDRLVELLKELSRLAKQTKVEDKLEIAVYACADVSHQIVGDEVEHRACRVARYSGLSDVLSVAQRLEPTPAKRPCPAVLWEEALPAARTFLYEGLGPGFLFVVGGGPPHYPIGMTHPPIEIVPSDTDWHSELALIRALGFGAARWEFEYGWESVAPSAQVVSSPASRLTEIDIRQPADVFKDPAEGQRLKPPPRPSATPQRGDAVTELSERLLRYRDGWWDSDLWQAWFTDQSDTREIACFILDSLMYVPLPEIREDGEASSKRMAA